MYAKISNESKGKRKTSFELALVRVSLWVPNKNGIIPGRMNILTIREHRKIKEISLFK